MRRRIEKSVRKCPLAPAERTLTMLAYLAAAVKRQNAAVRVEESGARRTHVGQAPASEPTAREGVKELWNKLLTTEPQRTDKKGAFLCTSVSLWLMQSIFSQLLAPAHGGSKETVGYPASAGPAARAAMLSR